MGFGAARNPLSALGRAAFLGLALLAWPPALSRAEVPAGPAPVVSSVETPAQACRADRAILLYPAGQAQFTIELAETPEARAQGLMQRPALARSAGMLFVYPDAAERAFWMKNTLIALDILFFDATGRLIHIHENARPFDLTPLPSRGTARFVLEINGGLAAKLRITEGARLAHPAIDPALAALPCR
ncbi:MAG: DUF192 domain-containing protein [Paracoccaceae bacterium]